MIIAGEGVAGASAAAALAEFGWEVLVVEPGLDAAKRLAGELIHPPGATDLAALGLLADLEETGGAPVLGFAVLDDPTMAAAPHLLPYVPGPGLRPRGFAMEHSTMAATLRRAVGRLSHVRVWNGARVVALDNSRDDAVTVTVSSDGRETSLHARLLVGADGAASAIRRLAGIGQERWRISRMLGYLLPGGRLPMPGYGTVFLGGPALALAYQVSDAVVRVMFDIPDTDEVSAPVRDQSYLDALPEPFRTDVQRAMADQRGLVSTNYSVLPERVAERRIVLVGDAAGCCHPLTATGLSVCTRDAMRLRDALRATGGSVCEALAPVCRRAGGTAAHPPRPGRDAVRRLRGAHGRDAPDPRRPASLLEVERSRPCGLDGAPLDSGRADGGDGTGVCARRRLHDAGVARLAGRAPGRLARSARTCGAGAVAAGPAADAPGALDAVGVITADVAVIAAGPAGAATALRLAQLGVEVMLVDRADFPRDKTCGSGLSPRGLATLRALGVWDELEATAYPISGLRLVTRGGCETYLSGGTAAGAAICPRRVLDHALLDRARALGVRFLPRRVSCGRMASAWPALPHATVTRSARGSRWWRTAVIRRSPSTGGRGAVCRPSWAGGRACRSARIMWR